jgi:hypothetical protein
VVFWGVRGGGLGGGDARARWGVNEVDMVFDGGSSVGDLLVFDFDPVTGQEECQLANVDSGGGSFIKDGGIWKLIGVSYSVDGLYDTNNVCGDSSQFIGAMFDATGYYIGADNELCDEWDLTSVLDDTDQSRCDLSRISTTAGRIQGIIQSAIDDAALSSTERYEDWIAGYGVVSDDLPGENADGDEWPNLLDYLGAGDPSASGDVPPFRVIKGSGVVQFEVRERLDFESLGLSWQITGTSVDVGSFAPVAGLSDVSAVISRPDGVTTRLYEIPAPVEEETIYRLEVTLAP